MNLIIKTYIVILLTTLSMAGCSSSQKYQDNQTNSPQSQRSNAKQAQDELSSETSR